MLRSLWDLAEALATGKLVRVLEAYGQEADVWAVYPTRLSRSPKVRILTAPTMLPPSRSSGRWPSPAAGFGRATDGVAATSR
jgi:LysR family transcriptional regulator, transcriptional activator for dmlA